jgi:heme exporter protein C
MSSDNETKKDILEVEIVPFHKSMGFWLNTISLLCFFIPWVARYPVSNLKADILRLSLYSYEPLWMVALLLGAIVAVFFRVRLEHKRARRISILLFLSSVALAGFMMVEAKREGPAVLNALNSPDQPSLGLYFFCFLSYFAGFVENRFVRSWRYSLPLAVVLITAGHGIGLFLAPEEGMMRDVGRILYVHVPTAWVAMLTYLVAFALAITSMWTGGLKWDGRLHATIEVGVVLNILLTIQGSIWAKPTWGVWWSWDPRLTTTAIMVISFVGVLLLRASIRDAEKRMTATGIGAILAFVSVPIVYLSVKWWNSLHQDLSNPDTVSSTMVFPLRITAFGMLFLMIALITRRAHTLVSQLLEESDPPELPQQKKILEIE